MKTMHLLLYTLFLVPNLNGQWNKVEQISSPYILSAYFDENNIYVGSDSLFVSTDKGMSWTSTLPAGEVSDIIAIIKINERLFAGTINKGVYLSSDNGSTWSALNNGLGNFANNAKLFFLSGDTLFYGTDGGGIYFLYLSSNTWQSYNQNLPSLYAWTVNDFTISSNNYILSSGGSGFYYLRPKGSAGWIEKTILTPQGVSRTPSAFLSSGDTVFAGTNACIYRSVDNGNTWDSVGISALPLEAVSFVKDKKRIYAGFTRPVGNDFFVWYSDDMGDSWHSLDHQFQYLFKLFINDNKLWAATSDGLRFTELSPAYAPPVESVQSFSLEQNYPNPFNPVTSLAFSIDKSSFITLKVYDILGKEIAILIDEEKPAGNYTIKFNASGLVSGRYLYKMQAGNSVQVKKMTLLK